MTDDRTPLNVRKAWDMFYESESRRIQFDFYLVWLHLFYVAGYAVHLIMPI